MNLPRGDIVPPGDFFYIEHGTRYDAKTFEQLCVVVHQARVANRRTVGDVLADVAAQLCERNPAFCEERARPDLLQPSVEADYALAKLVEHPRTSDFVTEEKAALRAHICRRCPLCAPYTDETVRAEVARLRAAATSGRAAGDAFELGACRLHRDDCGAAAVAAKSKVESIAPDGCWR